MARERDPNRDKAKEIYTLHPDGITNREISAQLGVDEKKIAVWKGRDRWDVSNVVQQSKKTVVQQKKAARKMIAAVEENAELTDKEKAFCLYYVRTFNATAAAIRAGYAPDYANRTAYSLKQKPKIQSEIKKLKISRNLDMLADADDVVLKFMRIAFADITDFVEFSRVEVPVMSMFGPIYEGKGKDKKPVTKEINEVRFRDSEYVDGSILSEVKQGKDGASVKLADRMKALDWLSNYFELNPNNKHKADYDKRRIEIELMKVQANASPVGETDKEDDLFLEAINSQAADLWEDGGPDDQLE